MKKTLITIISAAAILFGTSTAHAEKPTFSIGTDVVSKYVYRGSALSTGPSIQPGAEVALGGFALGTWASVDMARPATAMPSELDLYLSYSIGGFSAAVTHFYYFDDTKFFGDATQTEVKLAYTISDDIPLSISWFTMVGGTEKGWDAEDLDKKCFSSYIELAYCQTLKNDLSLTYAVGMSPWTGCWGEGFTVPSISVRADYEIALGDKCSMGTFLQPVYNTVTADFNCVLGCGFWF